MINKYSIFNGAKYFSSDGLQNYLVFISTRHINLISKDGSDRRISFGVTIWKVPKYRVFSGPYFPVFGWNTDIYSVNTGKYRSEITSYLDTFHAELLQKSHTLDITVTPKYY